MNIRKPVPSSFTRFGQYSPLSIISQHHDFPLLCEMRVKQSWNLLQSSANHYEPVFWFIERNCDVQRVKNNGWFQCTGALAQESSKKSSGCKLIESSLTEKKHIYGPIASHGIPWSHAEQQAGSWCLMGGHNRPEPTTSGPGWPSRSRRTRSWGARMCTAPGVGGRVVNHGQ